MEYFIRSRKTIFPDGRMRPASVRVSGEKISSLHAYDQAFADLPGYDADESCLMPALIDTHVHINEPGRTEWEGFETATRAAAAGGIAVVVDMPLNSIPATTTVSALEAKKESARGHCTVDYGLWGGVVPGNSGELEGMIDRGALGFKAFLIDSGVDEFPMSTEKDLRQAMPILARRGVPLLVHAELEGPCRHDEKDPRSYRAYLESRPQSWEVEAIHMMIRLSRETGCHVHVVHLSAADALEDLRRARADGVPITAETCPHYLFFTAETIPDGATQFKCAPPIRERENRERLWSALRSGTIDFVVSDHSPCTPRLKALEAGDFANAWGGISGLQFGLPVIWTAMRGRGLGPETLAEWMSARTTKFLGLSSGIREGAPANLVVWDPEAEFQLEPSMVLHKHNLTPYSGQRLFGSVERTYVRGHLVFSKRGLGDGAAVETKIGQQVLGPKGKSA